MNGLQRFFVFVVYLSYAVLFVSCGIEEPKQCMEGVYTCTSDQSYQRCVDGRWSADVCFEGSSCNKATGRCESQTLRCEETVNICLDKDTLHVCVLGAEAISKDCAANERCIGDACVEVCQTTENTCNAKGQILQCVEGELADTEDCPDHLACLEGECVCAKNHGECLDDNTLYLCEEGKLERTVICEQPEICINAQCADVEILCNNSKWDPGEEAVDCGGLCEPCVSCAVHAECDSNFCDSNAGYVCSKKCRRNQDCPNHQDWDGQFCRPDGRCASKIFATRWNIPHDGAELRLPLQKFAKPTCDFSILWGDEEEASPEFATAVSSCDETLITHVYENAGSYTVRIWGEINKWGNVLSEDAHESITYLEEVLSFGPVGLTVGAFYNAESLLRMPQHECPDASLLDDLSGLIAHTNLFNHGIEHWDMSQVTKLSGAFAKAIAFNQPLNRWDISKVTELDWAFEAAATFNQPLDQWDTGQVKYIDGLFFMAPAFNQDISSWNTSNMVSMLLAFDTATSFNQPLNTWDLSKVTNCKYMFSEAVAFNQDLSDWDVSAVEHMDGIFQYTKHFNGDITGWNTQSVKDLDYAFLYAEAFDQDLSGWDFSSVETAKLLFEGSGLSEANYCALLDVLSWVGEVDLGLDYECP